MNRNPILDLTKFLADIKNKEAAAVFSPEGQIIASDFRTSGRLAKAMEAVFRLAKTMAALSPDLSPGELDRGLLEGPKKKIVVHRHPHLGFFVVLAGTESMNTGLANLTAKRIAAELEANLRSKP